MPWSSMQQSWGPALLILAAVVLVEGEPPRVSGQGSGVAGPPLSQQACSSGGCEGASPWGDSRPVLV